MGQPEFASHEVSTSISVVKRRILINLVFIIIFIASLCSSLQAPFYPAEAELKGVKPTEYGFVFGVFQLAILITAPLFGKYIKLLGSAFLFKSGLFVASLCTILFGFLDLCPNATFFGLSIAIRAVAAIGESAVYTSSYVIAFRCYPNAMATALAIVETAFALGSILGPTIGGALYQVGGFRLPFFLTGAVLFCGFVAACIFIRDVEEVRSGGGAGPSVGRIMRSPAILILSFSIFTVAATVGFFTALIEPHLRTFDINPFQIGLVFMANGVMGAIASICLGRVVDKFGHAKVVIVVGLLFHILGLLVIGPLPFVPLQKTLSLVITGFVLCGFGIGCILVSAIVAIMKEILECGYSKNLSLQGFVSGMYNFLFASGCFIGPTIGGALYDAIGFAKSSLIIWVMHILTVLLICVHESLKRRRKMATVKTRLVAEAGTSNNRSLPRLSLSNDRKSTNIKTIA